MLKHYMRLVAIVKVKILVLVLSCGTQSDLRKLEMNQSEGRVIMLLLDAFAEIMKHRGPFRKLLLGKIKIN